jgi:uncharacterized protein (DUF433 family)
LAKDTWTNSKEKKALYLNRGKFGRMKLSEKLREVIIISPDILGGTPVFRDTRVPVKTLFDHLKAGDSLNEFLDDFPSVSRPIALKVLSLAADIIEQGNRFDEAAA